MSDDDHLRRTIKFHDVDLDEPDAEEKPPDDLLAGLNQTSEDVEALTNPFRPAFQPGATRQAEIPEELLKASEPTRTHRIPRKSSATKKVPTWLQFFVEVDSRGRIVLDAKGVGLEPGDFVQVLVRPEED